MTDLGEPQSFLVLEDGTPVYDRSGSTVGTVAHVLADDAQDVFHGLIIKTGQGHRFATGDQVDGIYAHGVIVSQPADQLPEPSEDAAARAADDDKTGGGLRRAWEWLIQPK
ncbi:PRC-barrel domain-containing protein [Jidongwangia harbinensis]|uniref:PRC-barrel domain-containing protein n=1 Tax=Jidongwangia harbinensis TaxID=2878561 RepID=UPI001CD92277|nr:PRC-barrel domain-containing protein [Jidongwangia harbinensis]MCA2216858.1 PRC-barrel domain-containing protein [Jidongwangia harbinensis]